jgi:hypothetical protein
MGEGLPDAGARTKAATPGASARVGEREAVLLRPQEFSKVDPSEKRNALANEGVFYFV